MTDERIRRRPAEREALHAYGARCFCLANGNLRSAEMAKRYLANLRAIARASASPGPDLYAVHADRLERLAID